MRILKDYDERKNEILDVAQRLFYSVGYDQTTVNAIIEDIGIAKGTFYYYFKSKLDLLENMIDRMALQIMGAIKPIIDAETGAVEKLRNFYNTTVAIKIENREMLIQGMKVMYRDENLITHHKMIQKYLEKFGSVYSRIIRQGVQEGIFNTPFPDDTGELIMQLLFSMGDAFAKLFLELDEKPENLKIIEKKIRIYENATERILGAKEGSLKLWDMGKIFEILNQKSGPREDKNDKN